MRRTVLLAAVLAAVAAPAAGAKPPPTTWCTRVTVYADARGVVVSQYDADHNPSNGGQCNGHEDPSAFSWVEFPPVEAPQPGYCYWVTVELPGGVAPTVTVCPPIA